MCKNKVAVCLYLFSAAGLPPPSPLFKTEPSSPGQSWTIKESCSTSRAKLIEEKKQVAKNDSIWVQCDNKQCLKWRRLSKQAAASLPEMWYCSMHPDPAFQSCDIPEEHWHLADNELFTYHGLQAGQLAWAKLGKYPP